MFDWLQKLTPILRFFFPEQRKWVARVFIGAGIPLVAGPVWEPYISAFLSRYADIRVPIEATTTAGWIFLCIGLLVFVTNEVLDRRQKIPSRSAEAESDLRSLETVFAQLHLPTLDMFIHYGKLSMTYYPVLHYFYGLEGVVQAVSYHVYDAELKAEIDRLYSSLSRALSFGEFFTETSNERLYKFDSRHDVHRDPRARGAHDEFLSSVYKTEKHLRSLCTMTRTKFPELDLDVTSAVAAENYRRYQEEAAL